MNTKLINEAIQYVVDNHLEEDVVDITARIAIDTKSTNVLEIATFVVVSIYINNKYKL